MLDFLARLVGILVLRAGPQHLPASANAMVLATGLYAATAAVNIYAGSQTPDRPGLTLAMAVLLPFFLAWGVLRLAGKPQRYIQTVTALFGVGALLALVNLPVLMFEPDATPPPAMLLALVAFFWHFAVNGHIWRNALEVSFSAGLAVAVVLFALSYFVITNFGGIT